LKKAMQNVIEITGTVNRLDKATVTPQPNHADIKVVKHRNSSAFALVSIPDYMASALDCKARTVGEPVSLNAPTGEKSGGQVLCDEAETSESRRGFRRSLGGLG